MRTSTFAGTACFLSVFLLCCLCSQAQQPNYIWAKKVPGMGSRTSICADHNGNLFAAGNFISTVVFGTATLTSSGIHDYYIARYDGAGNPLWARSGGGVNFDQAVDACCDPSGNCYMLGFSNSATLTAGAATLSNSGSSQAFLVKYDPAGNVLWAANGNHLNSSSTTNGKAVCSDGNGNVYISGWLTGSVAFGSYTLTGFNGQTAFVVKYDSGGNVLWARQSSGAAFGQASAVASDGAGNVFVAGSFMNTTLTIGSATLVNSDPPNSISTDVFLAKYDANGSVLWAIGLGETGQDYISGMTLNTNGSVILAGDIQYQGQHHYLVKYDSGGNLQWQKPYTPGVIFPARLTSDPFGNVLLTGTMDSAAVFGAHTLNTYGTTDVFILKCTPAGSVIMAANAGGAASNNGHNICDANGYTFLSGTIQSSIAFGPHVLTYSPGDPENCFIVKIDSLLLEPTGLRTIQQSDKLSMYPNPAKDQVTVKVNGAINRIEIINSLGEAVYSEIPERSMNSAVIGLQQLPKGLYVISIISGTQRVCKKMILEP